MELRNYVARAGETGRILYSKNFLPYVALASGIAFIVTTAVFHAYGRTLLDAVKESAIITTMALLALPFMVGTQKNLKDLELLVNRNH
ncbi:MAG TPA: hypothetical protein HA224_03965 [Nanoarchaeota archaeon]|nr:hypothetical protein [Nanoarchaeota archaeon]